MAPQIRLEKLQSNGQTEKRKYGQTYRGYSIGPSLRGTNEEQQIKLTAFVTFMKECFQKTNFVRKWFKSMPALIKY